MRTPVPVVFDLDGTLVDTEPLYYAAGRDLLAAHGVPGFTWQQHTRFLGVGTRDTLEALREEHGLVAPVEELVAEKNRRYLELAAHAEAFAGMRRLVERLHAAGSPLAVASGSSPSAIEAVLESSGLARFFPVRVSAEEVARGKPAPDVLLESARRLGVAPGSCVVVEDAEAGVAAAGAAGMRCVAVPSVAGGGFASAGLVFPGGQREFEPERAYAWITEDG